MEERDKKVESKSRAIPAGSRGYEARLASMVNFLLLPVELPSLYSWIQSVCIYQAHIHTFHRCTCLFTSKKHGFFLSFVFLFHFCNSMY
jgi:hypothetical protein